MSHVRCNFIDNYDDTQGLGKGVTMANRLQKLIYFTSAESPIIIMFAIVWLIKKSTWKRPIDISWEVPLLLLLVSATLIVTFIGTFKYGMKNLQTIPIKGLDIASGDSWIVAYVVSYLAPFISFEFGELIIPIAGIVIGVLLVTLTLTDFVTPHPVLYLLGYHFYTLNVEGAHSGYNLISRKRIKRASDVTSVSQVFEFLLLRKG